MSKTSLTPLAYAILGLLHIEPRTGYSLRKVFETTPMGHYSSSPGAIYPALKRLEERFLASSEIDNTTRLRPKQVYAPTKAGVDVLREWVSLPVSNQDVVDRLDELMLRFSFMGTLLDAVASYKFLLQMARSLEAYVETLEQVLSTIPEAGPPHGRLALLSGIENYRTQARWARRAMRSFKPE
jgi:DNA-binding PadR family transcriptional regulator